MKHKDQTSQLANLSFYSGLASIVFSFPANIIGIVSGSLVEDRYRTQGVPVSRKHLKRSRIGTVAGYASLIGGIAAMTGYIVAEELKKSKAENAKTEEPIFSEKI